MSELLLPSSRSEAWRWSDLKALPVLAAARPTGQADASGLWIGCGGPRLLFVDGRYVAEGSAPGPVEVGASKLDPADHPLADRARADAADGWSLKVAAGHAPEAAIEIVHVSTGGPAPLVARIELAEDAQASVVESFVGSGWANRLLDIRLARGARLMRAVRIVPHAGFTSLTDRVEVGQGASYAATTLAAGATDTRLDAFVTLAGEGGFAGVDAALLARGTQRHDANTVMRHAKPGGMSRQTVRMVADDRATDSFAGRIEVARGAQKTDAAQSVKGLLFARTATINAKPELEIFADDVKCAHGATVGELDRQALFYLASRGVSPQEARALLTDAFVADGLKGIGIEAAREAFIGEARAWLA